MSLAANDPEVIIFERSPFQNLDAIVQQDGRTVYFYLTGGEGYPPKACWLGNLVKGPMEINQEAMEQGIPPVLPRIHCNHPQGRKLPLDSQLKVVWFEEGNGAAVLEGDTVLGVIPPWSGVDGFCGYARDCIFETQVAWPMPQTESLVRRIKNALEFWALMETENPFAELQSQLLSQCESRYGQQKQYWAIDGQQFPPRGLLQLEKDNKTTFTTIGMSLFPQPNIEMYVDTPSLCRRVELAFQTDSQKLDDKAVNETVRFISSMAQMPWKNFTWFGHQHTCEFKVPSVANAPFALLLSDKRPPLLNYRDDPVNTLWIIPILEAEMKAIRNQDNEFMNSESFIERLPF